MAIFSNEWVLGGLVIAALFGGATVWRQTRNRFGRSSDKDS